MCRRRHVRFWPLADMSFCAAHVCFQSGHRECNAKCQLQTLTQLTINGPYDLRGSHASSDVEAPRGQGRDLLSFVRAPVRRKQATRDLTLKIISHPAAPRGDVVCNVAFSLPSTRLTHGFKKGAKDAPQDVDPGYHRFAPRTVVTNVRG